MGDGRDLGVLAAGVYCGCSKFVSILDQPYLASCSVFMCAVIEISRHYCRVTYSHRLALSADGAKIFMLLIIFMRVVLASLEQGG